MLESDLFELATKHGGPIRDVVEITRFINSGIPRRCFYIEFMDGQKIKGRILPDQETRIRITSLLSYLAGLPLSPLIASEGRCLIEKWIVGESLRLDCLDDKDFVDAANVLGAFHTIPSPDVDLPSEMDFVKTLQLNLEEFLNTLVEHHKLNHRETRVLAERAESNVPGRVTTGIIHNDFCFDNLVRDEWLQLHLVDNNSLQIGAIDFDIGKAFSKWPMSKRHRRLFLDTYSRHRSTLEFEKHDTFWSVFCLVRTIVVHLRYKRDNEIALECLKAIIRDGDNAAKWPGN